MHNFESPRVLTEADAAADLAGTPRPDRRVLQLDFSVALRALKNGEKLARTGWNGKDMFVYLVPASSYPAQTGAAQAHFGPNALVPYGAYFALQGADGVVNTWVPSVTDCLAEDWALV